MPENIEHTIRHRGAILGARIAPRTKPFANETIRRQTARVELLQDFDCRLKSRSRGHFTRLLPARIIRRLARDGHVVDMAFAHAGARDAHEFRILMKRRDVLAHTGPRPPPSVNFPSTP